MQNDEWLENLVPEVTSQLTRCSSCPLGTRSEKGLNLGGRRAVESVLDDLISILFPGCHGTPVPEGQNPSTHVGEVVRRVAAELRLQIQHALEYQCEHDKCRDCGDCTKRAEDTVESVLRALPRTIEVLQTDIAAAYEGDPAARSTMEVVLSYPGVYAIMVHRVAHLLYEHQVPLIPRVMSEHAHSLTGIDIHPGATIGAGFFIDHGTGVVIGETCTIGERVKIYQGVTLGALSFEKDKQGNLIKGVKRHPDVGDHVVIYAGATILGGKTVIGQHSEIGGNVWLIHSVPPYSKVYNQQPHPLIRQANGNWKVANGDWDDMGAGI